MTAAPNLTPELPSLEIPAVAELADVDQWVVRDGAKHRLQVSGKLAKSNDPESATPGLLSRCFFRAARGSWRKVTPYIARTRRRLVNVARRCTALVHLRWTQLRREWVLLQIDAQGGRRRRPSELRELSNRLDCLDARIDSIRMGLDDG